MNLRVANRKEIMKKFSFITLVILVAFGTSGCKGQVKPSAQDVLIPSISIEEKQKQSSPSDPAILLSEKSQLSGVDFRYAARKVTPGVVHVMSTWNSNKNQEELKKYDPFKDFFGDDFFHFFDPFSQRGPVQSSGSGVILTTDGYIITNDHVVQDADVIDVVLHDQRSYKATVIGTDPKTDLALIKIDERNLSFIEFGNSDEVEIGEWVLAVGNPFNLASTVTAGIVSAKARNINILKDREAVESFIQTDAAVNPGNSGGALVNMDGKLIGINSAIATPTGAYAGYSFAIPVNLVKKVADDLLNFGTVQRGYLGVIIRDMTGDLAKEKKIKFIPGVYVDSLAEGGAAKESGIKVNDIIVKVDNVNTETSPQLQEVVAKHRPGEKLLLTVMRDGTEKQISVTLKGAESRTPVVKKGDENVMAILGIDVQELSAREKQQYGLKNGLKVTQITRGRIQEYTNMKKGFIITKVDGKPVNTKDEFIQIIKQKEGGVMIEGIYPGSSMVYYYGFGL
jgi:serine protease Do